MAVKKLRVEDLLLGVTLALTFLYPLIITLIILYQDSKRDERELKIFRRVERVFISKNCKNEVIHIVPYLQYVGEGFIKELKKLCNFTAGKKPIEEKHKKLEEESLYMVKFKEGSLKILGKWISDEEFKVILITYEPET